MVSFENVLRTLGVLVCLYVVAYFVTSMSVAALNAATHAAGPMCGQNGCSAEQHLHLSRREMVSGEDPIWMAAFLQFD